MLFVPSADELLAYNACSLRLYLMSLESRNPESSSSLLLLLLLLMLGLLVLFSLEEPDTNRSVEESFPFKTFNVVSGSPKRFLNTSFLLLMLEEVSMNKGLSTPIPLSFVLSCKAFAALAMDFFVAILFV